MKKIIHLSDLHVGFEDMGKKFFDIVESLKAFAGTNAREYVIVITGDLVDNANYQDSYEVVKAGIESLKLAGFEEVLVVPGNHDYGTGNKGNKKFVKIFRSHYFHDEENYPRKNIIEDVAFIGLDSMAEELHWYDKLWAEGELGKNQLLKLRDILEEEDVRACKKRVVYLHHHPFDARPVHQLKDSKKLKKVLIATIAKGISVDAILYGHNHEGKANNGKWGIKRCYDGGSSTMKPRPKAVSRVPWYQVHSSIRVIDIENNDVSSDQEIRVA
ncbi:MAG: metallophosphoesterase [Candidatus Omnitrophica bacterium]|nr:metallophosphoesterase [Candidatus Omnitrophota bacterium]MBU1996153.1 metallophosphoesterase [Candidatus Omnitrophota bacterium]MBU4333645.1 metallophosphoesterase [Candidatus Omnitrophota bacterium]